MGHVEHRSIQIIRRSATSRYRNYFNFSIENSGLTILSFPTKRTGRLALVHGNRLIGLIPNLVWQYLRFPNLEHCNIQLADAWV